MISTDTIEGMRISFWLVGVPLSPSSPEASPIPKSPDCAKNILNSDRIVTELRH